MFTRINDAAMLLLLRVKERVSELSPIGKMMLVVMLLLVLCTLTKLGLLPRRRPAFHPFF